MTSLDEHRALTTIQETRRLVALVRHGEYALPATVYAVIEKLPAFHAN